MRPPTSAGRSSGSCPAAAATRGRARPSRRADLTRRPTSTPRRHVRAAGAGAAHWIPLVPVRRRAWCRRPAQGRHARRRRARVAAGTLLAPTPLTFPTEEIPREGITVRTVARPPADRRHLRRAGPATASDRPGRGQQRLRVGLGPYPPAPAADAPAGRVIVSRRRRCRGAAGSTRPGHAGTATVRARSGRPSGCGTCRTGGGPRRRCPRPGGPR